jgi:uncharacterized protein YegP (UPF0339 family)
LFDVIHNILKKGGGEVAKFEVYSDSKGEWRWRFKADNGRIIADSAEGYNNIRVIASMA